MQVGPECGNIGTDTDTYLLVLISVRVLRPELLLVTVSGLSQVSVCYLFNIPGVRNWSVFIEKVGQEPISRLKDLIIFDILVVLEPDGL